MYGYFSLLRHGVHESVGCFIGAAISHCIVFIEYVRAGPVNDGVCEVDGLIIVQGITTPLSASAHSGE